MTLRLIVIIGSFLYIAYVIIETIINNKYISTFKHVIHVNGTRGKSSVTRLIDAGLRECGFRVMSKTTGTFPTILDCEGNEIPIKRLGRPNIREQLKIVRKAKRQKAEALVVECMAIQPELQNITQHKMLQAHIGIITNVRHDHIDEMGNDLSDIARSLANTVPVGGHLIVGSNQFSEIFKPIAYKNNTILHDIYEYTGEVEIDNFKENIDIANTVGKLLNLDEEKFAVGMSKYIKDRGSLTFYEVNDFIFINGLAINDPDSIMIVYDIIKQRFNIEKVSILINNRFDRPQRAEQLTDFILNLEYNNILLSGSYTRILKRRIERKTNKEVVIIKKITDIPKGSIVFAIGNLGQKGFEFIDYCETYGRKIDG